MGHVKEKPEHNMQIVLSQDGRKTDHPNRLSEYQEIFYCTCNQSLKNRQGGAKDRFI